MTNLPWSFSIEALRERFALDRLVVLNDFAALALATPLLGTDAFRPVGAGAARPGAPIAVLGPGTGLGVAGLLQGPHGTWLPVVGEGGHATLCAVDAVEEELLAILRRHWPHVSAERVLSGSGLVNLHRALGDRAGETVEALAPADIVTRALDGRDPRCIETVERFLGFLGSFAGNLALTLGAQGGVYIGGGIVPRLGDRIATSCFRERFESKGRFRSYLTRMPTWVITTPGRCGPARRRSGARRPAAHSDADGDARGRGDVDRLSRGRRSRQGIETAPSGAAGSPSRMSMRSRQHRDLVRDSRGRSGPATASRRGRSGSSAIPARRPRTPARR